MRTSARPVRDWTSALQVVTGLVAIGSAIAVVFWLVTAVLYAVQRAGGGMDVVIGATLPSARHVGPVPPAEGLAANVGFATGDSLPVAIGRPSTEQYVLAVLERLPTLVVYAAFFALLWRLVAVARRTTPYTAGTVWWLRLLGVLLLVGALVAELVEAVAQGWLSAVVLPAHGFLFDYDLPTGAVVGGAGLLAVSEVVRRGMLMREDLEGTV